MALTIGDAVHLTATARNINTTRPWTLQIWEVTPAHRLLTSGTSVTTLYFEVIENTATSHTYQAVLDQPPGAPINSNEVEVAWAERTPKQLILEVNDRKVTVNYTFEDLSTPIGAKVESVIWKPVFGADPAMPFEIKASATGLSWTAAVNWTAPLHGKTPAQVHAYFDVPLPPPWALYLSLGGSGDKNSLCGPQPLECRVVIPHPANPTTAWLVGAFLYRDKSYVGRVDININWAFP